MGPLAVDEAISNLKTRMNILESTVYPTRQEIHKMQRDIDDLKDLEEDIERIDGEIENFENEYVDEYKKLKDRISKLESSKSDDEYKKIDDMLDDANDLNPWEIVLKRFRYDEKYKGNPLIEYRNGALEYICPKCHIKIRLFDHLEVETYAYEKPNGVAYRSHLNFCPTCGTRLRNANGEAVNFNE